MLRRISHSTEQLNRFANDLLIQAKQEAGTLLLQPSDVRVNDLLEEVLEHQRGVAESKRIQIKTETDGKKTTIHVDQNLMLRALENLVANAIKYSPTDTVISIQIEVASDSVCFHVADHGLGIPVKYRDKVFEKYSIVKAKQKGLAQVGLGLAFCKMVADAHGGWIKVRGNKPNGSIFTLAIPSDSGADG